MAQMTNSFRPPWAVTIWSDDNNIYVEMPMKDTSLPPYIMKLPFSEGGLQQALYLLRRPKEEIKPTYGLDYTKAAAQHPTIKHSPSREKLLKETTESQREMARRVLEKLGIK